MENSFCSRKITKAGFVLKIERVYDTDTAPEFLQTYIDYRKDGCSEEDAQKYAAKDAQRVKDWENNKWSFVGVLVTGYKEVKIKGRVDRLVSLGNGSLWGIESDSGESYFEEVENDCISQCIEDSQNVLLEMQANICEA